MPPEFSHSSLPAMIASPHFAATHAMPGVGHAQPASIAHVALQPSPAAVLPSSHASVFARLPSPHVPLAVDPSSSPVEGHGAPSQVVVVNPLLVPTALASPPSL